MSPDNIIVQPIQNKNSRGISEGCTIIPYKGGEKSEYSDGILDLRGGAICHFYIHNNLPIYNFYLKGNVNNKIDQIEITKGIENETFVQKLEVIMDDSPYSSSDFFGVIDMNFDGYKDIRLLNLSGATGNKVYNFWLFDPSKNIFVKNEDLSSLSNPTPNPQSKTIETYSVGGMTGCIYRYETYKFDETGKLILIRFEKQDYAEETKSFVKTIGELKDGEMVTNMVPGYCRNY